MRFVLDWNPSDPDTSKVHYDVTAWSLEQRSELAEVLANDEIAHVWEQTDDGGQELVVPEELEAQVDALFEQLEEALGPFPVSLPADAPSVEYGLDEWPAEDRATLTEALVEGNVPHRWEGTTVHVPPTDEQVTDEILDAIESGTLVLSSGSGAPPEDTLSRLFTGADRLAKDSDDAVGRDDLADLVGLLDAKHQPYGVPGATWAKVVATANDLVTKCGDEASASDVIGAAQALRSLVRQYV